MSIATEPYAGVTHAPHLHYSVETLRGALLWLTGLFGAFVFMEPSPYEIASLLAIVAFMMTGMTLRFGLLPFAVFLILYNLGFAIAVVPVLDQSKALLWVLVSFYLSTTALFFAVMLGQNTEARLRLLLAGYTTAAVIAASAGIIGYFRLLPGMDLFVLHDRARGTFNDPNVMGAFLVLPALLAFQRMLAGRVFEAARAGLLLLILLAGIFLSFSRGAWGQFALAAAVIMVLEFITTRSARERLRIAVFAVLGVLAVAAFIAALLSLEQVSGLFKERASLEQSYDVGHMGRFGRHVLGFLLTLDHPLGIGALQFHKIFPEDPHNAYLNAFVSGGWISGFAYLALVVTTLTVGLRFVFVTTPWRPVYLAVYAAFVGLAIESIIIDTDHWRHYFLVLGVLWGLMSVSRSYVAARRRNPHMDARPARTRPGGLAPPAPAS